MSEQSATPSGVVITATLPNGSTVNVTAGVQTLYDCVIQSMDWASGFLTIEDTLPILEIAQVCGFKGYEEAERYVENERQTERERTCSHPSFRYEPYSDRPNEAMYLNRICEECGMERITTKAEHPDWREAWSEASAP